MTGRKARSGEGTTAVGDVLGDVLKRVDPEQQLRAYRIWSFWNDEVGEGIARRARPTRFRNGILFVTVATHSWMQELQFMKDRIRERLNARLDAPLVRDIFFISGSLDADAADSSPNPTAAPAAPVAAGRADIPGLPAIDDPVLAAAFARIIEARAQRVARATPVKPRRRQRRSR